TPPYRVTVTGPPPWPEWRLEDACPGWVTVTGPPPGWLGDSYRTATLAWVTVTGTVAALARRRGAV
ncbi:hypothetical protein KI387_027175, partial [Taxus chinensis]